MDSNAAHSDVSSDPEDSFERIDHFSDDEEGVRPSEGGKTGISAQVAAEVEKVKGIHCDVCDRTLTDSAAFLDHINNHVHHRERMGLKMAVKSSCLEEFKARQLAEGVDLKAGKKDVVMLRSGLDKVRELMARKAEEKSGNTSHEEDAVEAEEQMGDNVDVTQENSFDEVAKEVEESAEAVPDLMDIISDEEESSGQDELQEISSDEEPEKQEESPAEKDASSSSDSDMSIVSDGSTSDGEMEVVSPDPASPQYCPAREWIHWVDAIQWDLVDKVKEMVERNEEIVLRRESTSGSTGLHMAADHGALAVCEFLVSTRPSLVHEMDTEGNQPLHLAAISGCNEIADVLLAAGSSPTLQNFEKESPIDLAACPRLKRALTDAADARGEAYGLDPLPEQREIPDWWASREKMREEETVPFLQLQMDAPQVENNRENVPAPAINTEVQIAPAKSQASHEVEDQPPAVRNVVNGIVVELEGNRKRGRQDAQRVVDAINNEFLEKAENKKRVYGLRQLFFDFFIASVIVHGIYLLAAVFPTAANSHPAPNPSVLCLPPTPPTPAMRCPALPNAHLVEMGEIWFEQELRSGRLALHCVKPNITYRHVTGRKFRPHAKDDLKMMKISEEAREEAGTRRVQDRKTEAARMKKDLEEKAIREERRAKDEQEKQDTADMINDLTVKLQENEAMQLKEAQEKKESMNKIKVLTEQLKYEIALKLEERKERQENKDSIAKLSDQLARAYTEIETFNDSRKRTGAMLTRYAEANKRLIEEAEEHIMKIKKMNEAAVAVSKKEEEMKAMNDEMAKLKEANEKMMKLKEENEKMTKDLEQAGMETKSMKAAHAVEIEESREECEQWWDMMWECRAKTEKLQSYLGYTLYVLIGMLIVKLVYVSSFRAPANNTSIRCVKLSKKEGEEFGVKMQGAVVKEILPGSAAESNEKLKVGLEIVGVNRVNTETMRKTEIYDLIRASGNSVRLWVREIPGRA